MKKAFILFFALFLFQFILSCGNGPCSTEHYDNLYNGLEVTAYDTSKLSNKIIEEGDTTYRYTFGLEILVHFETIRTGMILPAKPSYGFTSAVACGSKYSYPDPIDHAEIFVIDAQTDEKINITANFGMYQSADRTFISLEQFFEERELWNDGFRFDLIHYQNIPTSSIFVIEIYFASGKMFSESTQTIVFQD